MEFLVKRFANCDDLSRDAVVGPRWAEAVGQMVRVAAFTPLPKFLELSEVVNFNAVAQMVRLSPHESCHSGGSGAQGWRGRRCRRGEDPKRIVHDEIGRSFANSGDRGEDQEEGLDEL